MATIGKYLSLITNAVYGEEVRSAIVNAIQQCYTDATDVVKVSETEPTSENTRIWIKPTTDECKVPTWEEFQEVAGDTEDLKSATGEKITILKGSYVNKVWTNNGYSTFLKVSPGSLYSITAGNSVAANYYGLKSATIPPNVGDSAVLSDASGWNSNVRTITAGETETGIVPSDVNYLWFLIGTNTNYTRKPTAIVISGINVYDPLSTDVGFLATTKEDKTHTQTEIARIDQSINGIDNTIGEAIQELAGRYTRKIWDASGYSAFVPVFPGSRYSITAGGMAANFYGLKTATVPPTIGDSADLSDADGWDTNVREITAEETENGYIPDDVHYLYFYYGTNTSYARKPTKIEINGVDVFDSVFTDITGLAEKIEKRIPILSKKIAFFGDSLTSGVGTTKCYHQYIGERYGFTCYNYGYGGSGYVWNSDETNPRYGRGEPGRGIADNTSLAENNVLAIMTKFVTDEPTKKASLDGVVIFAGTNDWFHVQGSGAASVETFTAGVESVFEYYQTNFGDIPLLVVTPVQRKTGDGIRERGQEGNKKTIIDYANIIIDKCRKYGIPYVDALSMSGLNPWNAGNQVAFFTRDQDQELENIHPNHLGHERISRAIGETLNQLVKWDDNVIR